MDPAVEPARVIEHRTAAAIAEKALATVFGAVAVQALREDSPLGAVGLTPSDLVCISDAVASDAAARRVVCVLDDDALAGVATVGDLVAAIETHARVESDPA